MALRREGAFFGCAAVFMCALITLPYLYAWLAAGPDLSFGGFLLNPIDGNSYLAKMYIGWRGGWRFTLPYTLETSDGAYINLFYIFLGHLARWTGLNLIYVFHIARLLAAMLMAGSVFRFLRLFRLDSRLEKISYVLLIIGSGLGWLGLPFDILTSDFWVAEIFPFLSSYTNPHFPLGLTLMLEILRAGVNILSAPGTGWKFRMAGLSLLLGVVLPFGIPILILVFGATAISLVITSTQFKQNSRRNAFKLLIDHPVAWVLLGGGPVVLYEYWAIQLDPLLSGWNAQNLTPTPPVWDLAISLSPPLLLAAITNIKFRRRKNSEQKLLLAWMWLGLASSYIPFGLQRRFTLALYLPAVILAFIGIDAYRVSRPGNVGGENKARLLSVLLLILALPTNFVLVASSYPATQRHDLSIYLTRGEIDAYKWIEDNTPPDTLIIASPSSGLFIPAYTGRRVIYGHPFETVDADSQKSQLEHLISGDISAVVAFAKGFSDRRVFLFWGPREIALNNISPDLPVVYRSGGVTLYTLSPAGGFTENDLNQ